MHCLPKQSIIILISDLTCDMTCPINVFKGYGFLFNMNIQMELKWSGFLL